MFLIISLIVGAIAFLVGLLTFLFLAAKTLGFLVKGHFALAGKCVALFLVAVAGLAFCHLLLSSQPVEWPWAPWHIPLYAASNLVFVILWRLANRLARGESGSE